MAHLTYNRLKVTQAEKLWHFVKIGDEAGKAVKVFIDNVPKEKLGSEWR
jgi:hypothetical protein